MARSTLFESLLIVGTSSSVARPGLEDPSRSARRTGRSRRSSSVRSRYAADAASWTSVRAPRGACVRHRDTVTSSVRRRVVVDVAAGGVVGAEHVEVEARARRASDAQSGKQNPTRVASRSGRARKDLVGEQHLGEGPVGRGLAGDAAERSPRRSGRSPRSPSTRRGRAGGGGPRPRTPHGGAGPRSVKVTGSSSSTSTANGHQRVVGRHVGDAVGADVPELAVDHHQLAVEALEGADAERAPAPELADGHLAVVAALHERG